MRTPADLPDPVISVEGFAALSALLADPFADRPAVLSAAGLDAERWRKARDEWAQPLRDGGIVAERFAEVFGETLRAAPRSSESLPPQPTAAHPFAATVEVNLSAMLPAVRSPHPSSPPNPLADTLESAARLPVPSLTSKTS